MVLISGNYYKNGLIQSRYWVIVIKMVLIWNYFTDGIRNRNTKRQKQNNILSIEKGFESQLYQGPFEKCFTGRERKYIKDDYLNREEVLEYILYKVLHTSFYEFTVPDACATALDEFKTMNNPVKQFLDEILPELTWDFVPQVFLYDLYKSWMKDANPSEHPIGKKSFYEGIRRLLRHCPEWVVHTVRQPIGNKLAVPEPLIAEYNLISWMNPHYSGKDLNKICIPNTLSIKGCAGGKTYAIERVAVVGTIASGNSEEDGMVSGD